MDNIFDNNRLIHKLFTSSIDYELLLHTTSY